MAIDMFRKQIAKLEKKRERRLERGQLDWLNKQINDLYKKKDCFHDFASFLTVQEFIVSDINCQAQKDWVSLI